MSKGLKKGAPKFFADAYNGYTEHVKGASSKSIAYGFSAHAKVGKCGSVSCCLAMS